MGLFRYTGQIWLEGSSGRGAPMNKLIRTGPTPYGYYKARAYNPYIGRFMQTDPIGYGDGMNMYAYTGNDPVNGRDPSGLANTQDISDKLLVMCNAECMNRANPHSGSSLGSTAGGFFATTSGSIPAANGNRGGGYGAPIPRNSDDDDKDVDEIVVTGAPKHVNSGGYSFYASFTNFGSYWTIAEEVVVEGKRTEREDYRHCEDAQPGPVTGTLGAGAAAAAGGACYAAAGPAGAFVCGAAVAAATYAAAEQVCRRETRRDYLERECYVGGSQIQFEPEYDGKGGNIRTYEIWVCPNEEE